ncbi:MAG: HAMP domain-containing protein [Asgard group archaeon]|nr:HAMP domain-containing protein [Asgard group archaeon]
MQLKIRKKLGLRELLLLSFTVLCIISLGCVAITSSIFMGVIGNITSSQTTDALESEIRVDMQNQTENYALIIQSQLEQVTRDIDGLADVVTNLFQDPFEFDYRRSYYHVDMLPAGTILFNGTTLSSDTYYPENIPPDAIYDPELELMASYNYSHYLIYDDTYSAMGNDEYNLTGIHGLYINRTAHLDPIMRDLILNNDHYSWIYIEFEIGVQRTFPWTGVDTTVFGPDWYDYKNDPWYINAKAANGNIVWTAPYLDPYIGWIVTISRAVYNGSISPSNFLGVIGIDFTLEAITQTVGNIQLFDTGYGFLIDQDGWVISHPNVEFDPGVEDPTSINNIEPLSATLLSDLKSGNSGFAIVTKNSRDYYLAYEPIPISNYVLGLMVPDNEVLAPVNELQEEINLNLIIQWLVIILISIAIIALSVIIGRKIADTIIKPIKKLTNLALELSTEDIKKTSLEKSAVFDELDELTANDDEIGGLSRSFKNLILMVRDEAISESEKKKDTNNS